MLLISSWPRAGCSMPLEEVIDHEYFEASTSSYCLLCLALCSRHYTIWVIFVLGHTCSCSQRSKQAGCKEETRGYRSWDDFDIILTMFYFSIHASDLVEKMEEGDMKLPLSKLMNNLQPIGLFFILCAVLCTRYQVFCVNCWLGSIFQDFIGFHSWAVPRAGGSPMCAAARTYWPTDKTWEAFDTIAKGFQRQILVYNIAIVLWSYIVMWDFLLGWRVDKMAWICGFMRCFSFIQFQWQTNMYSVYVCIYINICTFIFVILLANDQRGWGQYIHELIPASAFRWWFSLIGIIFCHPTSPGFFQKRPYLNVNYSSFGIGVLLLFGASIFVVWCLVLGGFPNIPQTFPKSVETKKTTRHTKSKTHPQDEQAKRKRNFNSHATTQKYPGYPIITRAFATRNI